MQITITARPGEVADLIRAIQNRADKASEQTASCVIPEDLKRRLDEMGKQINVSDEPLEWAPNSSVARVAELMTEDVDLGQILGRQDNQKGGFGIRLGNAEVHITADGVTATVKKAD